MGQVVSAVEVRTDRQTNYFSNIDLNFRAKNSNQVLIRTKGQFLKTVMKSTRKKGIFEKMRLLSDFQTL